jgi:hypothetical protein
MGHKSEGKTNWDRAAMLLAENLSTSPSGFNSLSGTGGCRRVDMDVKRLRKALGHGLRTCGVPKGGVVSGISKRDRLPQRGRSFDAGTVGGFGSPVGCGYDFDESVGKLALPMVFRL